jgi:nucleotide-binding universal stress UspA family protein
MYARILAAIDLTPNESAVLHHAMQLARLAGSAVHLLHVAPMHFMPGDVFVGKGLGVVSADDDIDPRDREMINDAVAELAAAGVAATAEVLYATEHDIADVIVDRAKELDASLIVLGETLHRGATKLFRAAIADEVIHRHPTCPVLLVP